MMSYPFFSRWRPAAILDLIWVMLDRPRSAIVGLRLVLKFGSDPIVLGIPYCDSYILPFWLEIDYSHPVFWGGIFPPNTVPIDTKICVTGNLAGVITCAKFEDDILGGTILQGVEFPIFLLIFAWALQQCGRTVLFAVVSPNATWCV